MWNVIAKEDGTLYRDTGQIIPTRLDRYGYPRITIYLGKSKYKTKCVHRIVAEQLIPNPNSLPQVNHKDGNKCNNSVANLEWVTNKQNMKHAYVNGLSKFVPRKVTNAKRDSFGRFSREEFVEANGTP